MSAGHCPGRQAGIHQGDATRESARDAAGALRAADCLQPALEGHRAGRSQLL